MGQDARICVGEKTGFFEDQARDLHEIGDRRLVAEVGELVPGDLVAKLGLVAEGKERLVAACLSSGSGNREHLFRGEEGTLAWLWWPGKGAVVADVAAKLGQRDENLRREGDQAPGALIAERLGAFEQFRERNTVERVGGRGVGEVAQVDADGADARCSDHASILEDVAPSMT